MEGLLARLRSALRMVRSLVQGWIVETVKENTYLAIVAVAALIRAMGVTVQSGTTGAMFSFGRFKKVVPPGFQFLVPFLQKVEVLPTRSRTVDLPAQRVTTFDGLVFHVDVNLVYRIVDVRKALVEVDDLGKAMRQVLGLSVQEVLRGLDRASLHVSDDLDADLERAMEVRLEPWGVDVEHAGFTSILPSRRTLQLTQLAQLSLQRATSLEGLERAGFARGLALPLLGSAPRVERPVVRSRQRELEGRARRRVLRVVRRTVPVADAASARLRKAVARRALRERRRVLPG